MKKKVCLASKNSNKPSITLGILWLKNQVIFLRFAHFNTNFLENKVFPFMVVQITILFLTRQKHNVYSSYLHVDTTCSSRWLNPNWGIVSFHYSPKSVKYLRVHTYIFACALKLSICANGALCYLGTKSALT